MKIKFLLGLIISLTIILRLYNLGKIPSGFYSDESIDGYEAYSILKTGKDQYGNYFPISFKAFGDFRPGLFIYSLVPSVWVFGLNEFAVRLPSAIYSSLIVFVGFLLANNLLQKKKLALLTSFYLAIVPFSLQFGRMAHDTNLATLLMSTGVLLYLYGRNNLKFIWPAFLLLSLSFYVYYTTRVIIPVIFIVILVSDIRLLLKNKIAVLFQALVSLLILSPFLLSFLNTDTFFSRINSVSIWGDKGIISTIIEGHRIDNLSLSGLARSFHNKAVEAFLTFTKGYFSHLNPDFLLFQGDLDKIYKTPASGLLFYPDLLLLVIGGYYLIRNYPLVSKLVFLWLALSLLPDSLTRLAPTASRIHFLLPALSILIGSGIYKSYTVISQKSKLLFTFILALYMYNFSFYLHQYYFHLPVVYAKDWHYGLKSLSHEIQSRENNFTKIWISKTAWGWVNFAFYLKYPPQKMQQEIILADINEYGLGWVYQFGKYYFDYFPSRPSNDKNILYVGEPWEFPQGTVPEKIIYYPDNTPAFYIVPAKFIATPSRSPSEHLEGD